MHRYKTQDNKNPSRDRTRILRRAPTSLRPLGVTESTVSMRIPSLTTRPTGSTLVRPGTYSPLNLIDEICRIVTSIRRFRHTVSRCSGTRGKCLENLVTQAQARVLYLAIWCSTGHQCSNTYFFAPFGVLDPMAYFTVTNLVNRNIPAELELQDAPTPLSRSLVQWTSLSLVYGHHQLSLQCTFYISGLLNNTRFPVSP